MLWLAIIGGLVLLFGLTAFIGAPYVPTHRREVRGAFAKLRPITQRDVVCDIGSGDGVVLVEAARRGARGVGFEINPVLVAISRLRLLRQRQRVRVRLANFWRAKAPRGVTVVYTFGDSRDITKMYQLVQRWANEEGRTLDFISYAFAVDGKKPLRRRRGHFLYAVAPQATLQLEKT